MGGGVAGEDFLAQCEFSFSHETLQAGFKKLKVGCFISSLQWLMASNFGMVLRVLE